MFPDPVIIKADGRDIAVEDSGPGSGFPIIMMNGAGSRHLFRPAVREGRDLGFRLIGYDRPGCGGSTSRPGRAIADCADDLRAIMTKLGISRSFQIPQLFSSLSVRDNLLIAESIAAASDPKSAADAALARFGLEPYASRLAGSLSEGIRKLLDVAMALSSRSKLLLLDEPTSGVSADEKFGIMDVVMGAARDAGVRVIFVEHDMDIVARFAGRVVAFYEGGIIGDGPPQTVLRMKDVRRYVIGEEAPHAQA